MSLLWLWVLLAALIGGLALTGWGAWWLWRKVTAVWRELERLLGLLDEIGKLLEDLDMSPLEEGSSSR